MTAPTLKALPAAHWRVLNHIRTYDHGTPGPTMQRQHASWEDLRALEDRELIAGSTKRDRSVPIRLADWTPSAGQGTYIALWLTGKGDRLVDSPPNRVLRVLARRGASSAHLVKQAADVGDDTLREVAQAGLIRVQSGDVPLDALRRIPAELLLRLTNKGAAYTDR